MTSVWTFIKSIAKAIASGLAALVGTTVLALSFQPAATQGIQYITQAQWGSIILAVLASYGITWRIPNGNGELPGEVTGTTDPIANTEPASTPAAPATVFPKAAVAAVTGASVPDPAPASQPYLGGAEH